jgi:hypothetical protein
MKLIQCKRCGTQNRFQKLSFIRLPICGKCRAPLQEAVYIRWLRAAANYKYWIVLGSIIGGTALTYHTSEAPGQAVPEYPVVAVSQGVYERFTNADPIAPFMVVTPSGPENYYVKLVDAFTGHSVMSFFIFGGQRFETKVPLGSFRVKYATGKNWYGENHLFGPSTRFSEADRTFEFAEQGNQISGYTVELIKQRSGNLHTKSISASQF